ncbi:amidase [Legionella hackeliae]|uniref:Amidase (Enantiomer selective) n=1 Tax=Legionella hackeliae TaxID=449 RepID=A0A0A8UT71_LEGHA|nr:amidase [Legionella hackeliae]KTD11476.1 amidase [Legionella hackeliae]CEK10691.1 Amidase (Enantiomer selective) [Legionella hackeliae]STX47438.1 amidase family protein [Legionella hackeliae]
MHDFYFLTATQLIELMKTKQVSAEEIMRAHLDRIDSINPTINALTQRVNHEHCINEARKVDILIANNKPLKKLSGLPIAIKDALNVKGLICSSASPAWYKAGVTSENATIVSRLQNEGAIIVGLTNVPEMCRGGDSDNLIYGRTNNPYDLTKTSGGSSGGSAALVAAGGVPLAIGSDGGGSIVQPSHCNGIAALKPTHGRVPPTGSVGGDAFGLIGSMICYGPMARSVNDLLLGLTVIAGPDGSHPYTPPVEIFSADPLAQLRVAYFTENGFTPVDKDVQKTVKDAALSLSSDVSSVTEDRPSCIGNAFNFHWDLFLGGDRGHGFKGFLYSLGIDNLSWELQEFVRQAELCKLSTTELNERMIAIDHFRAEMLSFMKNYDVVISPVFPTVAKKHGIGIKEISDFSYAMAHNLTGWPTTVVRCGTSSDGLPIGVQIAAQPWKDTNALAIAERLEQIHGGWHPPLLLR